MNVDGLENARILLYLGDIPVREWDWTEENEAEAKQQTTLHRERGNDAWWAIVGEE